MRLYIPTCTLNFNNILSSESISPLGFYAKRGFGNKRFYPVCANDKEQAILLYSKYPRFKVEENDLENYSMVIAIESDDYKNGFFEKVKEYDGVETYLCYHTINLNPFHCHIYFNNYQERQGALSKAEQSLENKFYKLYTANIAVKLEEKKTFLGAAYDYAKDLFTQSEKDDFSWNSSHANCEIKKRSIDVSQDILLDRIKGFIYCYLIGANSSVSNEVGKLKLLSRRLRNTLSAVVNSPDKKPTQIQDDTILKGIREFNETYSSIDEDSIFNQNLLESKLSNNPLSLSSTDAEKLLRHWGVYDAFCDKLHLRRIYDANELWSCLEYASPELLNSVIDRMNSAVRRLETKENSLRKKFSVETLLNIDENLSLQILDSSYNHTFYGKLICSQFAGEYKRIMEENGVEEPLAQAYNGGMILKKMLGDKWNTNNASVYIGALLNHFQENSSFDLFAIDNEVLSSFAAFCQKGDSIDRLEDYLVQKGFCNYKLAFGIYGATRGFASLPKTFTSVLINGDKDYYQSFAISVWQMLNGVEIKDAVLPKMDTTTSVVVGSRLGDKIIENINNVEPRTTKQKGVIEAVSKAGELEDTIQSPKAFMYILDSFPNMTRTRAYKNLVEADFANDKVSYSREEFKKRIYDIIGKAALKSQQDKIDKAIELEAKRQDPEAFLYILDNFLDKSSRAYRKIANLIKPVGISTSKLSMQTSITEDRFAISDVSEGQRNLRPINATSANFVDDINASNFILSRSYLPNEVRDVLEKKIISFQKDYAPNGYYYGREGSPRTNDNTIKHFINRCTFTNEKNPSWIPVTEENKALLERLKQELYDRYANR